MEAGIFLTGMIEEVFEFVDSNVIATFLIAMGIVIMLGVVYGAMVTARMWMQKYNRRLK